VIIPLAQGKPEIGTGTFLAPSAVVVGQVTMGTDCSVWFNTTIRGDVMPIVIGSETNIQDNSVVHGTYKKCGARIGNRVSVGHGVILHGCDIGDRCLIGMGAIIMDQAKISHDSLVAAGSLVIENAEFPPGVLIMGRPAKVQRPLTPQEIAFLNKSADNYLLYKTWYEPKQGDF
jgi:gamma-carbonic anhydrase